MRVQPNTPANVVFMNQSHLQEAQRIALHTSACNALAMAGWNLNSDAGSIAQAIAKAEAATAALRRLQQIGGAA
jgi:hypothetical protein